jgi:hypothetical protein
VSDWGRILNAASAFDALCFVKVRTVNDYRRDYAAIQRLNGDQEQIRDVAGCRNHPNFLSIPFRRPLVEFQLVMVCRPFEIGTGKDTMTGMKRSWQTQSRHSKSSVLPGKERESGALSESVNELLWSLVRGSRKARHTRAV